MSSSGLLRLHWLGMLALFAADACAEKRSARTPTPDASRQAEPAAKPRAPPLVEDSAPSADQARALVELGREIDQARIEANVAVIAKPRVPGSRHWKKVQELCAKQLRDDSYTIEHHAYGSGVNVIGKKLGSDLASESVIVSAHYDHIAGCAGADDNASGVAAILEIARVLGPRRSRRSLLIACWDEEERGLLGSRAFANRARARGERILVMYSLDAIGFANHQPFSQRVPPGYESEFPSQAKKLKASDYRADFLALVGNTAAAGTLHSIERAARGVGLGTLSLQLSWVQSLAIPDAYRSDHASFWLTGYPAVLLTDTGNYRNPAYHCQQGSDAKQTLDYGFLARAARATAISAAELSAPVENR